MDMDYLLILQNFREATNNFLSPFLMWLSDFAVGFWPVAMACMVYWVFDRKEGKRILAGFGLGMLANGLLKLTFRITRPWLRDERIVPYGDSINTATGYSFPSGHSTFATSLLGGIGWWQRKRNRKYSLFLFTTMVLVFFSRNYLGVHTPQDVLVGFASTSLMMILVRKIENWTDANPSRDWIVMAGGLAVCTGLALLYSQMEIQPVYNAAGALVVDPEKMKADSFEGIGFISSFVICRFFERRYFHFDKELKIKDRFIICTFALIPLHWWCDNIFTVVSQVSRSLGRFVCHSGIVVYTLIIVPFIMSKVKLPSSMEDSEAQAR